MKPQILSKKIKYKLQKRNIDQHQKPNSNLPIKSKKELKYRANGNWNGLNNHNEKVEATIGQTGRVHTNT